MGFEDILLLFYFFLNIIVLVFIWCKKGYFFFNICLCVCVLCKFLVCFMLKVRVFVFKELNFLVEVY